MDQKRNGSTKTVKNVQQFFILVMKIKKTREIIATLGQDGPGGAAAAATARRR